MMVTGIAESISGVLYSEYGYENYIESIEQGLDEPCFFIQSLKPSIKKYPGKRYLKQNPFCIQYISESTTKRELHDIGENLLMLLETISYDSGLLRGTDMSYEVTDDILHFFVNYDFFVRKPEEDVPRMESVNSRVKAKG